jgi:hypothetical protein
LPPEEIISSHAVHSKVECSLKCLQKSTCVGYNYKPESNEYAVNCQLSNKTQERESDQSEEWTFYQDLETVSNCEHSIRCKMFKIRCKMIFTVETINLFGINHLIYGMALFRSGDTNEGILYLDLLFSVRYGGIETISFMNLSFYQQF